MSDELPPGLRPWASSLAFLTIEAALHLGPLVRRFDALVRGHDAAAAATGEPDGYGGLSRRGRPEQIVLSEWLLADELPDEFLRRAAARELLHISPVARAPQPAGRVAAVFDVGPDQLGAARLVQLAALVVLHRRAAVHGSELVVGILGEPPERWHGGALAEQFEAWRHAATARPATRADLDERAAEAADEDELWVLTGPPLADACASRSRLVSTREHEWDAAGATSVELRFDGRRTVLALPTGPVSVRALRGRSLRRAPTLTTRAATSGAMSAPSFPSTDRRLLLRGEGPDELIVVPVPTSATGGEARPRTHRFEGPVIAASSLGRRLVVLVLARDRIVCRVVGKSLGGLDQSMYDVADLDLEHADDDGRRALPALYYDRGGLLCRPAREWWRLQPGRTPERQSLLVAVAPGRSLDVPARLERDGTRLRDGSSGRVWASDVVPAALRVTTGTGCVAWSCDRRWHIRGEGVRPSSVTVEEDCDVLGIVTVRRGDDPALLTRSGAGVILRLHAESGVKTLTACSGFALGHALHPALGLLAIQRDEDTVDVVDIAGSGGDRVMRLRAP